MKWRSRRSPVLVVAVSSCRLSCSGGSADRLPGQDQRNMAGLGDDLVALVDQFELLDHDATPRIACWPLFDEAKADMQPVARDHGLLEAHMVPAERSDRGFVV